VHISKIDLPVACLVPDQYSVNQLRELNDLQLAFVGGGIGDVIM